MTETVSDIIFDKSHAKHLLTVWILRFLFLLGAHRKLINDKGVNNNEASQDKAILLIDEIDSFLQNRNQTQHSSEISAINEILTQMESHDGIFIASTNRMEELDTTALRRFDLKVRFNALQAEQL